MVVFVCNGCGDTLKRSEVDTHCYRCGNCDSVSCVDCNQDFYGNDYKQHQTCITELEKYSSKSFVPKVAKGVVKQDDWLKRVQNAVGSTNLPPKLRPLAQKLKTKPNVPRSKARFINFMKNCMGRGGSVADLEELWNYLIAFTDSSTAQPAKSQVKKNKSAAVDEEVSEITSVKESSDNSGDGENPGDREEIEMDEDCNERRKWIKGVHQLLKKQEEVCPSNIRTFVGQLRDRQDIPSDRKLFAKFMEDKFGLRKSATVRELWQFLTQTETREEEVVNEEREEVNNVDEEDEAKQINKRERKQLRQEAQTKKQKKNKQKETKLTENGAEPLDGKRNKRKVSETDENSNDEKKALKRKRGDKETDGVGKKNKKNDSGIDLKGNESVGDAEDSGSDESLLKLHPKKFSWQQVIGDKVRHSKSQEMKLTRLKKIVIGECLNACGSGVKSHDRLDRMFNNALRRCSDLKLDKDRVVLQETNVSP